MAKELAPIDITNTPELLRVAEDVRATNTPRVLRRDNEDIAMVVPLSVPARSRQASIASLARELAAGFQAVPALKQSLSVEAMVRMAAEEHAQAVHGEGR